MRSHVQVGCRMVFEPTIAKQRAVLDAEIADLEAQRAALQVECEHTFATKKSWNNSGYDYDLYGCDFHCEDCGKRWTEDQ